jgi:integrase
MAIFKRKYTDPATGEKRTTGKYYVKFADHHGTARQMAAFESKRASQALYSRISELVSYAAAGQTPEADLQRWIDTLPRAITSKLATWGIISGGRQSAGVLVAQHIAAFKQYLLDKGCTAQHINTVVPRVEKTLKACRAINLTDISPDKIQRSIGDLQISEQTRKHYIRALKQFSKWLHHGGRTSADMLSRLDMSAVNETVRDRRALTTQEAARLLQAAKGSDIEYQGISGYERYLIYSLALSTGLRANEIRTLTVSDFNFIGHTVTIKPRNEKNRKGTTLPIQAELSEEIRLFTANKLPAAKALNVPARTADMLKPDLKDAGIEYQTDAGFADFHSLRHTFGTALAQAGVTPQVSQRLMRHSDPRLTQNLYTHLLVSDLRSGADKLPDYSKFQQRQAATGTADMSVKKIDTSVDTKSSAEGGFSRTSTDLKASTVEALQETGKPACSAEKGIFDTINGGNKEIRLKGFEPQTFGSVDRCTKNTSPDNVNTYKQGEKHLTPQLTPKRAPKAQNQAFQTDNLDPDLERIISAWDRLPEHIRQAIKSLADIPE